MTSRIKPNSLDNNNNNNNDNYGEKEKTEDEVKVRFLNPGTLIDKIICYHMTPTVIYNISINRVSQKTHFQNRDPPGAASGLLLFSGARQ